MQHNDHQNLIGLIWNIANKLCGPYRPPQYRKVMLPLIVLRRLDLVLAPTKDNTVIAGKIVSSQYYGKCIFKEALINSSFRAKLCGDPESISANSESHWIPAGAGMTTNELIRASLNNKLFCCTLSVYNAGLG